MAHTGIYATKAEIDIKVGASVDGTGYVEANINASAKQSESYINIISKKVWAIDAAAFTALSASVKYLLSEASACWIAIDYVNYDLNSYTTRYEAESMVNILWAKFHNLIFLLSEQDTIDWIAKQT